MTLEVSLLLDFALDSGRIPLIMPAACAAADAQSKTQIHDPHDDLAYYLAY